MVAFRSLSCEATIQGWNSQQVFGENFVVVLREVVFLVDLRKDLEDTVTVVDFRSASHCSCRFARRKSILGLQTIRFLPRTEEKFRDQGGIAVSNFRPPRLGDDEALGVTK